MDEDNPEVPMELADHNYEQSNENGGNQNDEENENNQADNEDDVELAGSSSDDTLEYETSDDDVTDLIPFPNRPFGRYTDFPLRRFAIALISGEQYATENSTENNEEIQENDNENELFENYLQEPNEDAESFDTDLPAEHLYLGTMERVSGVKYFLPGRVYTLRVFHHHTVIYPGETFPMLMKENEYHTLNRTDDGVFFGLIFIYDLIKKNEFSGVTCQIYERGVKRDGSISIKSRVCQRFEVCTHNGELKLYHKNDHRYADVKILPDIVLPDPLISYSSQSLIHLSPNKYLYNKLRLYQSNSSVWPKFIYDQYDISIVLEKIENYLRTLKLNVDTMPSDMVLLSFWLARHIPLEQKDREIIFLMNCATQRILHIGKSLNFNCGFCCTRCGQKLALYNSMFAMSKQGIKTSYCNPAGYVHETVTVYNVQPNSIFMTDVPSTEFSWFPGYAWQIALCKRCQIHIGWRFTSTNPNMVPRIFYALAGKSIDVKNFANTTPTYSTRTEEVF